MRPGCCRNFITTDILTLAPNSFGQSTVVSGSVPVATSSASVVLSIAPSAGGPGDITTTITTNVVTIPTAVPTTVSFPSSSEATVPVSSCVAIPEPVSSGIAVPVPFPDTTFATGPSQSSAVYCGGNFPQSTVLGGPVPTPSSGGGAGCSSGHPPAPGIVHQYPNDIALKFGGEWVTFELKPVRKHTSAGVPHGTPVCGPEPPIITPTVVPPIIITSTAVPIAPSASPSNGDGFPVTPPLPSVSVSSVPTAEPSGPVASSVLSSSVYVTDSFPITTATASTEYSIPSTTTI